MQADDGVCYSGRTWAIKAGAPQRHVERGGRKRNTMEEKCAATACGRKLELEYPCYWVYKLIGLEQEKIRLAVTAVLQERQCLVTLSHSSRKGKYHCLDVEVVVHDETERTAHYEAFRSHPAITMVL